jgi:hypothetical protein
MNDLLLAFFRFCRLQPVLAAWLTTPVGLTALQRKKLQPAPRTSEIDILQALDTHLCSLFNISVHITGSYSRFPVLACSTHVLAPVIFPSVHTSCCPHVTGTPSQSFSSSPVKYVALTWWLAKYQPRECLGAARWYCGDMLTPPASTSVALPPWLCLTNTCFPQLFLCVLCFPACSYVQMWYRWYLSRDPSVGKFPSVIERRTHSVPPCHILACRCLLSSFQESNSDHQD